MCAGRLRGRPPISAAKESYGTLRRRDGSNWARRFSSVQPACGALSAIIGYVESPQVGGLSGLQQMFQEKGLGGLMSSWVGRGQHLPKRPLSEQTYFSRRITSPWPTSWSFSHRRYLYVAALLPGRGGPLSSRMPAGGRKKVDEDGTRLNTKPKRKM